MSETHAADTVIHIKVFADLRKLAPAESDFAAAAPVSIKGLIDSLGIPAKKVTVIFLNGRHAEPDDKASPGDTLALFPPVGGG